MKVLLILPNNKTTHPVTQHHICIIIYNSSKTNLTLSPALSPQKLSPVPVILTKAAPLLATTPAALMRDYGTISLIPPTDKIFPTIVKSSEVALRLPVYTETKNKLEILCQCVRNS